MMRNFLRALLDIWRPVRMDSKAYERQLAKRWL